MLRGHKRPLSLLGIADSTNNGRYMIHSKLQLIRSLCIWQNATRSLYGLQHCLSTYNTILLTRASMYSFKNDSFSLFTYKEEALKSRKEHLQGSISCFRVGIRTIISSHEGQF